MKHRSIKIKDLPFRMMPDGSVERLSGRNGQWKSYAGGKPDRWGYRMAVWMMDDVKCSIRMHGLVWALSRMAWPPKGLDVDHIDNDASNNHPDNLQLLTRAENTAKMAQHCKDTKGHTGRGVTKLLPHRVKLIAMLPSWADWAGLAERWGCHKVALLGSRSKARREHPEWVLADLWVTGKGNLSKRNSMALALAVVNR